MVLLFFKLDVSYMGRIDIDYLKGRVSHKIFNLRTSHIVIQHYNKRAWALWKTGSQKRNTLSPRREFVKTRSRFALYFSSVSSIRLGKKSKWG